MNTIDGTQIPVAATNAAVPIDPLRLYDHLRKVPRDAPVVAYCRGPFCAYACEAVRALESEGIPA